MDGPKTALCLASFPLASHCSSRNVSLFLCAISMELTSAKLPQKKGNPLSTPPLVISLTFRLWVDVLDRPWKQARADWRGDQATPHVVFPAVAPLTRGRESRPALSVARWWHFIKQNQSLAPPALPGCPLWIFCRLLVPVCRPKLLRRTLEASTETAAHPASQSDTARANHWRTNFCPSPEVKATKTWWG